MLRTARLIFDAFPALVIFAFTAGVGFSLLWIGYALGSLEKEQLPRGTVPVRNVTITTPTEDRQP